MVSTRRRAVASAATSDLAPIPGNESASRTVKDGRDSSVLASDEGSSQSDNTQELVFQGGLDESLLQAVIKTEERADVVVKEEDSDKEYTLPDEDEAEGEETLLQSDSEDETTPSTHMKRRDHRTARTDFVFKWTQHYKERLSSNEDTPERGLRFGSSKINHDERTQIWTKIMKLTNDKFAHILGDVSLDQIKRMYMNRIKRPNRSSKGRRQTMDDTVLVDQEPLFQDTIPAGEGGLLDTVIKTEQYEDVVIKTECEETVVKMEDCDMAYSLPDDDEREEDDHPIQPETEDSNTAAMLVQLSDHRSARTNFVVKWTKFYKERMCSLDGKTPERGLKFGRSHITNGERLQMWTKVMELTNKKFAHLLGAANVDQIKKMYVNRVSRPTKTLRLAAVSPSLQLNASLNSDPSQDPSGSSDWFLDFAESAGKTQQDTRSKRSHLVIGEDQEDNVKMDSVRRSFDRTGEEWLRKRIVQKDAEIDRLKKVITEQAEEHRRRMNGMLEMVKMGLGRDEQGQDHNTRMLCMLEMIKVAVGEQTAAEIATVLQL